MHSVSRAARACFVIGALFIALALAPGAAAHAHFEAGDYHLEVGWANEPTFVGQSNAIEVFVNDHDDKPVTDLDADALAIVVSASGQDTPSLPLNPAFSVEEGWGTPGRYTASLIPTVPGEYTVHITGTIHGQAVDDSITSGEETFDSPAAAAEIEFPVKNPSLAEVTTRLDRIDGRIQELQSDPAAAQAVQQAQTAVAAAQAASASADRAMLIGIVVGGAGVLIAVVALWYAQRVARRGTARA
jgi:hypothetical protein